MKLFIIFLLSIITYIHVIGQVSNISTDIKRLKIHQKIKNNKHRLSTICSNSENQNYSILLDSIIYFDTKFGRHWEVYFYNKKGDVTFINYWDQMWVEYNFGIDKIIYNNFDSIAEYNVYSKKIQGYPHVDTVSLQNLDLRAKYVYNEMHQPSKLYYYGMGNCLYWIREYDYYNWGGIKTIKTYDEYNNIDGTYRFFYNENHNDTMNLFYSLSPLYPYNLYPSDKQIIVYDSSNRLSKVTNYQLNLYDSTILYFDNSTENKYDSFGNIKSSIYLSRYNDTLNNWTIDEFFYRKMGVLDSSYHYYGLAGTTSYFSKKYNFFKSNSDTLPDSTLYFRQSSPQSWIVSKRNVYEYNVFGLDSINTTIHYLSDGSYNKTITGHMYYSAHEIIYEEPQNTDVPRYQMYPNPFTNLLSIKSLTDSNSFIEISIFDVRGTKVLWQSYQISNILNINTSNLKSGVYFYKIKQESGYFQHGKIIKL